MADILLIEPDLVLAETYLQALSSAGHSVGLCTSAQSAVLVADQARPDLVLLELQLVTHSGIEFLYEFRSYPDWHDVPVIIHSAVPPQEFESSWPLLHGQLGVADYLYKPRTSLAELVGAVEERLKVPA